ncbi:hypothetical protein ABE096_14795 [Robertmurraya massiliosenegalensis]|uniref:hypothetical protein n=1 Tax=Robertmurraya TaxID=2837507 RepID=UPI0039A6C078
MIASLIQSLQKQHTFRAQTNSFQLGQIIYGRIGKLFPNQTAEVQVGNQKVIAKLEVPLSAGGKYWFQIQSGEGRLHLKVLPFEESGNNHHTPVSSLLKQVGLPETKENREMIQYLLREKLPITKETSQATAQLINEYKQEPEKLEVLKEMMSRNLPLTKQVFAGVLASLKKEPLHQMMDELSTKLRASPQLSKDGQQLVLLLEEMTKTGQEKVTEKVTSALLKEWLNNRDTVSSQNALSLLQKLSFVRQGEERELLFEAAKKIASKTSTLTLPINENSRIEQTLQQNQGGLTGSLLKAALMREMENGIPLTKQILSLFTADGKPPQTQQIVNNSAILLEKMSPEFTKQEMTMLQNSVNNAQEELVKFDFGKSVADHLRMLVSKIGFDYESRHLPMLKGENGNELQKLDVLKALLLRVINEESSGTVKGDAEQLLHKITGIQLLSQETAPFTNYVLQVPLPFWEKKTDLTVQWSGSKKENGEIDPAYCRVLFYLELEHLNEVIVDMQIQNRIMNMTIVNDTEKIKFIAEPFINGLKENLRNLGFTLTSISFQPSFERVADTKKKVNPYTSNSYSGVDIRV